MMYYKICPFIKTRVIEATHRQVADCTVNCPFFDKKEGKCPVDKDSVKWVDV